MVLGNELVESVQHALGDRSTCPPFAHEASFLRAVSAIVAHGAMYMQDSTKSKICCFTYFFRALHFFLQILQAILAVRVRCSCKWICSILRVEIYLKHKHDIDNVGI